jgi:voltage-gated potassium channel Kch
VTNYCDRRSIRARASVGGAVGKIALLVAITFFVGKRWLPEFLGWIAATRSRELTASGLSGAVELIRAARDANPKIHIVARTVRLETKKSLLDAGADRVFSAEGEMALSITECLLQSIGATQDQLEARLPDQRQVSLA